MTQPDTLAKLAAPSDFPPRIMALLRIVADRKPGNGQGPWEDEQGEPMQDDADAAIAWISAQALPAAPEPVAWRVRGYNQFKTGTPGPWRYFDGPTKPGVNTPDCCDIEPLTTPQAAQQAAQAPCGKCDECGKGQPEGWALYCVSCLEKTGLLAKEALPNAQHVSSTAADLTGPNYTAAQAPAGWVMVPKVATQPMCEAAHYGPQCAEDHLTDKDMEWLREMWAAMLSALPQPPQPQSAQPQEDAA